MFNITLPKLAGIFSILFAAVVIPPVLFLTFFQNNPDKVTIHPEFNINTDLLNCVNSADALVVKIDKPTDGQIFLTTDNINFDSSTKFNCENLAGDKYKSNYKYEWFLNSADTAFSTEKSGSLGKKSEGSYNLKLKVILELVGLQTIERQTEIKFKVNKPVLSAVTQNPTTKPPTKPPTQPANKVPTARILSPKEGSNYSATFDPKSDRYYAIMRFSGTGSDPEDGNLTGSSLKWYYKTPTGSKTLFGNGQNPSLTVYVNYCSTTNYTITLEAVDSKGAKNSVNINVSVTENSCLG